MPTASVTSSVYLVNFRTTSDGPTDVLTTIFTIKGEYSYQLWISSTMKEKEERILQWWVQLNKIETFRRLTARAQNTQLATNVYHNSTKTITAFNQGRQTKFNVGGVEKHAARKNNGEPLHQVRPTILAKQEDSTSTWSNSQNRKILHPKDSAPNLVQYSQNRKIPHQTGNLVQYSQNRKIPRQT